MGSTDLQSALKEIPGYKAIMKLVLQNQIQMLIEQLSDHTGDESIVLTASVNDGSLSYLGSSTGKGFLEGQDEVKSQFLAYCLKRHLKRKSQPETSSSGNSRNSTTHSDTSQQTGKRPRLQTTALRAALSETSHQDHMPDESSRELVYMPTSATESATNMTDKSLEQSKSFTTENEAYGIVIENVMNGQTSDIVTRTGAGSEFMDPLSLPSSIRLDHTQTSCTDEQSSHISGLAAASVDTSAVKQEPLPESEADLTAIAFEPEDVDPTGYNEILESFIEVKVEAIPSEDTGDGSQSTQRKGVKCAICYRWFGQKCDLERHIKTHTGDKRYKCNFCERRFVQKIQKERHQRMHTGERPFKCEKCGSSYTSSSNLGLHIRTKHSS